MDHETLVAKLNSLYKELVDLRQAVDSPGIEGSLREMLTYCHLARWQIGATNYLNSEWEEACLTGAGAEVAAVQG